MKTYRFLVVVLLLTVFASSCRKDRNEPDKPSFTEVTYDPTFDWNTSRVVNLEIQSTAAVLLDVSSIDGQVRYHKGFHEGGSGVYSATLSLPKKVTEVMVNEMLVSVAENTISVNLSK